MGRDGIKVREGQALDKKARPDAGTTRVSGGSHGKGKRSGAGGSVQSCGGEGLGAATTEKQLPSPNGTRQVDCPRSPPTRIWSWKMKDPTIRGSLFNLTSYRSKKIWGGGDFYDAAGEQPEVTGA